ncbi:hypothetical protein HaLaN_12684 [Haematococcus lacustris]|uniref:Uncharacterized protein n=1 Tax=Haematococcus lacustris TaxID=44745 RepID=A0A699ZBN0_HAELA|nr:hypothetical protein HaLaN_12684 [Haematococcus lacustris]
MHLQSEERFFSACWSADASTGAPLLLIAGLKVVGGS